MLPQQIYQDTISALEPVSKGVLENGDIITLCKSVYNEQFQRIREAHYSGEKGLFVAAARSSLMDALLESLYKSALFFNPGAAGRLSVVALGGYGRGFLNPYSDVDILLLSPKASTSLPEPISKAVEAILYPLWDLGFKVGHSSRNIMECLSEARTDVWTLTALLEARFIMGNKDYFQQLQQRFNNTIINKRKSAYLTSRMEDLENRHRKYSYTVFLQEPNIKESPGGLRDYQNILWTSRVTRQCTTQDDLVRQKLLSRRALHELTESIDFMFRIRNELHFQAKRSSDILTLRMQGIVATAIHYPERTILRRTEAFMRDYYRHARAIEDRLRSVLEILKLAETLHPKGLMALLPFHWKKREKIDGFIIEKELLFAESVDVFEDEPLRLMSIFFLCQTRGLDLAPSLRNLIKNNWALIDNNFRNNPAAAETFQSILERKGNVARILRMMHRVGVLGRWMPEFGALDCLVQHEFYHRYTADEHTLRCIDQLDNIFSETIHPRSESSNIENFRQIFRNLDDPYALYMALLLHDSGRAENVREHIDGSALLAEQACKRLHIVGGRRRLILFLVDQHLAFWRCATTKNIDDVEVISEFAKIVKTQSYLETLYLFTYSDSLGTNEETWSSWKESLMKQLFKNTSRYFIDGDAEAFLAHLDQESDTLKELTSKIIQEEGISQEAIHHHLDMLPKRYFRFRKIESVIAHIHTMQQYQEQKEIFSYVADNGETISAQKPVILWRDFPQKGYTEFVISAANHPFFLEKLCCALASQQINILSAEIFTRCDDQILDILRICTIRHEAVSDERTRKRVEAAFTKIHLLKEYNPQEFLQKKPNFLTKSPEGIAFPVLAQVRNDINSHFTIIEIQAFDRIGLLHDVFHILGSLGLHTVNARIATEKGAALDTIYTTTATGEQLTDTALIAQLEAKLEEIIML